MESQGEISDRSLPQCYSTSQPRRNPSLGFGVNFDAIQVFVLSHNYDIVVEITLSLQRVGSAELTCGQYSHQEGIKIL